MINKITGRAKKHDGTAIDYVSIFNWNDGKCIAQVTPNAAGDWQYNYRTDLEVGLTYVADGCEPITHGSYSFNYQYDPLLNAILHYDFNGNVLDQSPNNLNGIKTGNASFVAGRKEGTQALQFTAGCVRTPQVLPIDSEKLTVSFWISTSQPDFGVVYELSPNTNNNNNTGACYVNDLGANEISSGFVSVIATKLDIVASPASFDDSWQHCVVEIDRALAPGEMQKIYIDNVLSSTQNPAYTDRTNAQIASQVLYIGQRGATSAALKAKLQDFRVYNRVLTSDERTALFNE